MNLHVSIQTSWKRPAVVIWSLMASIHLVAAVDWCMSAHRTLFFFFISIKMCELTS